LTEKVSACWEQSEFAQFLEPDGACLDQRNPALSTPTLVSNVFAKSVTASTSFTRFTKQIIPLDQVRSFTGHF
jgi:hypothetical protein